MARSTDATLNNLVTDEEVTKIRNIYMEQIQINMNPSIETAMFPEDLVYSKQIKQSSFNRNIAPVKYTTDNAEPPTKNVTEILREELYSLPVKKEKEVLNLSELS